MQALRKVLELTALEFSDEALLKPVWTPQSADYEVSTLKCIPIDSQVDIWPQSVESPEFVLALHKFLTVPHFLSIVGASCPNEIQKLCLMS